ncbi:helix-turn-helix domain-containing protein [Spiroplasma endosymbiont of Agriotes lineatus]|uniref:helix-turn-helix domain-containing protein n=1 Tax=Spiroplasma endosymbiont of Agriotes lineatus TaxID=3077930 RepID=UPI0030D2A5C5
MGKNSYTDEFKKQIVMLYQNGKSIIEIINEYGISKSAIYNWIKSFDNSGYIPWKWIRCAIIRNC